MGFYSSVFVPTKCASCGTEILGEYQFRYGNVFQKEYSLGDEIELQSEPPRKLVAVYAFRAPCPNCKQALSEGPDEHTLYIENGRIRSIGPLIEDLHQGPNYLVVEEN